MSQTFDKEISPEFAKVVLATKAGQLAAKVWLDVLG